MLIANEKWKKVKGVLCLQIGVEGCGLGFVL